MWLNFIWGVVVLTIVACSTIDSGFNPSEKENTLGVGVDSQLKIIVTNDLARLSSISSIQGESLKVEIPKNFKFGQKIDAVLGSEKYSLYYSELPIVIVNTNNVDILDEPKIPGSLQLVENGKDPFYSLIGIELRGFTSQLFYKKSYSIELKENGSNRKESLLGMRKDDDWVLDGMGNEPLRIRDVVGAELWRSFGRATLGTEAVSVGTNKVYCELFLNGRYRGVYYLGEKYDRKQLDLDKSTGQLFKGIGWSDPSMFYGTEEYSNDSLVWGSFEREYPKDEANWKNLHNAVSAVVQADLKGIYDTIQKYYQLENLVDYYLFLNLVSAGDNIAKNIYTAKPSEADKMAMFPWDLDGTFGNNPAGERIDVIDTVLTNGLFFNMHHSSDAFPIIQNRWNELRSEAFHKDSIMNRLKFHYAYLKDNGVYEREALNEKLPFRYSDQEISYIESWLEKRISFLDVFFGKTNENQD